MKNYDEWKKIQVTNDEVQMYCQSLDTAAEKRCNLDQIAQERLHSQQVGLGTSGNIGSGTKKKSGPGLFNIFG